VLKRPVIQWDGSETIPELIERARPLAEATWGEGVAFSLVINHDDDLATIIPEEFGK
jgi:hypothetical protein